jgi:L-ascorbate metabolism protein UlaG (beta-lactamase superfamily)
MTIIETPDLTVVTDPVFRMLGIRQNPKAYTFERMPRPDLVFISHTHLDHFEPSTLKRLAPDTPVWMPADKLDEVSGLGLGGLRGVHAWEVDLLNDVRLTTVPARHTGGELGLIVEGDRTVYFAGDTLLDEELFETISQRWTLDAVLLPIGHLHVLFVPIGHIGPKQAAHALQLLGSPPVVVPTHYSGANLFPFLTFRGTPRKLSAAIQGSGLGTLVGTTRPLETIEL